ncbi:hypothetical protein [Alishewanella tabrizica]|uniref:WalW protein n=1 Tax=Alishewanella tabrizica TaxID=671278 RepID=A0ABQ2WQ58_9ALTE|nr:hypothetical protein [Alishewanella tabrizica]GGW62691.1 hypothetical protein GCM10008111_18320 [Alishewanella tabrizica]
MIRSKLTVIIHAEEEFDWGGGFFRSNNNITHGAELTTFVDQILATGVRVVLAMDYAFVSSEQGTKVIEHFKQQQYKNVEFASHLHPWVNPPFEEPTIDGDEIEDFYSFPGNLSADTEEAKLTSLTTLIEQKTGRRPTTYLAGRYGTGANTYQILKKLGYKLDVSISAFADFSSYHGPDFSNYTNSETSIDGIRCIPHTSGYISYCNGVANYFNRDSQNLAKFNNSFIGKVILKLLGVKRVRLSPEGYSYKEMHKLLKSLNDIGVENFIFSFHSPSVKVGLTPYIPEDKHLSKLRNDTLKLLNEFSSIRAD